MASETQLLFFPTHRATQTSIRWKVIPPPSQRAGVLKKQASL